MAEGLPVEEDPFEQYLSQDQSAGEAAQPIYTGEPTNHDSGEQLRLLVACAHRQEQLLGKVCSLLAGLDDKVNRLASSQESLEARIEQLAVNAASGVGAGAGSGGASRAGGAAPISRGSLVHPPGKSPLGGPPLGGNPLGGAGSGYPGAGGAPPSEADQRLQAEKIAAERLRIEEEGRRRAEELARKREDDERRKREDAERQRIEEERRAEEERQRKEALQNKTNGLMSGLLSGSGGGGLFDEEPKRKTKGGLFDD